MSMDCIRCHLPRSICKCGDEETEKKIREEAREELKRRRLV
jgi:hypothetical protein